MKKKFGISVKDGNARPYSRTFAKASTALKRIEQGYDVRAIWTAYPDGSWHMISEDELRQAATLERGLT